MNTQTYTPQQSWTMSNDNKIINLSNQNDCFNVNDGGNLEIANCINSEKWNYIGSTGQVKAMKPVGGKNKCLTLKHTPENGADKVTNRKMYIPWQITTNKSKTARNNGF